MHRRLRIHIVEGNYVRVFEDNLRRDLVRGDLLENRHRIEQFSSSAPAQLQIFSRTKQVTSSRDASQARDQALAPRRCFIDGCNPKKCISRAPVARMASMRFSSRSKNASS